MVMIPASVFYFVFGFITCVVVFIIISVYLAKKQERKANEISDKFFKSLVEHADKDDK